MPEKNQVCTRCVSDTTIPNIRFDADGVCNFCKIQDALEADSRLDEQNKARFTTLIEKIKREGRHKEYDCVVGVSGGRDSTYVLYNALKLGLRPLAVHFDNGWNSEIAVANIKKATNKLNVDLHTVVADWEEFKDLQKSFLRASVSDAEIPTDYAILSVLYKEAARAGTRYILNGHSFRTEGIVPLGWTYMDGRYVHSVHKKFGRMHIRSFPVMSMADLIYYTSVRRITFVNMLKYIEYDQKKAGEIMSRELGWQYYGGHHHENVYTHFFQSYLLPKKFGIDKRKIEYSALIRSGQMTREAALAEIAQPYPFDREVVNYTISKLGLSRSEFEDIMAAPPKTFHDYGTYYPVIKAMKLPIRMSCSMGLLPMIFYQKYLG
ncbi:MAG TPA: N-acetyl sugar amidotransferase [Methanocella sp.]|jgi:N-acetyl sugar amidotransferase